MRTAVLILATLGTCFAQATTRPVVLSWTASPSTGITGYNVYRCAVVSPATSCTPAITGTPLTTVTGTGYTDSVPTGTYYGYAVTAVAPPCTSSSSPTSPCGQSASTNANSVPVPPQPASGSNVVVVVP